MSRIRSSYGFTAPDDLKERNFDGHCGRCALGLIDQLFFSRRKKRKEKRGQKMRGKEDTLKMWVKFTQERGHLREKKNEAARHVSNLSDRGSLRS